MGAEYLFHLLHRPTSPDANALQWAALKVSLERSPLENLPKDLPCFVLETGGTDIEDFIFPKEGIVIIGSEELGVSPEALSYAQYGRVSIPMTGIKASLNVGVAFGILMYAWTMHLNQ